MKKMIKFTNIFLICLMAISFARAQAPTFVPISNAQEIKWLAGKSYFQLPFGTTPALNQTTRTGAAAAGALYFKTTDSSVYVYTGSQFIKVSGIVSTPTWQETLDESVILDKANMIDGAGFDFGFDDVNNFTTSADSQFHVANHYHILSGTSISIFRSANGIRFENNLASIHQEDGRFGDLILTPTRTQLSHQDSTYIFAGENVRIAANENPITFGMANGTGYNYRNNVGGDSILSTDEDGNVIMVLKPSGAVWGSITGTLSDQTDLQSELDDKQDDITLTTTGTSGAATLVGATLNIPQYAGGGTTVDEVQTASGSTAFTFTTVPASYNDYMIFVNGCKIRSTTDYTTSGNVVTISSIVVGDLVQYQRIK